MKKIFIRIVLFALLTYSAFCIYGCKKEDQSFCWDCLLSTVFNGQASIDNNLEYCDKTVEQIEQIKKAQTFTLDQYNYQKLTCKKK